MKRDRESEETRKQEILNQLLEEQKAVHKDQEDWATQAQYDMLDWIEEQGIYIRQ